MPAVDFMTMSADRQLAYISAATPFVPVNQLSHNLRIADPETFTKFSLTTSCITFENKKDEASALHLVQMANDQWDVCRRTSRHLLQSEPFQYGEGLLLSNSKLILQLLGKRKRQEQSDDDNQQ